MHPKTKQEYALARTERKQGQGYTGFACYFAPDVTLEQDLLRRDLTINAMAQDEQSGEIFDPYGGQQDIAATTAAPCVSGICRRSAAGAEVSAFLCPFLSIGFYRGARHQIIAATIGATGELQHLTAERVWQETARALQEATPAAYFELLQEVGALEVLMPELAKLWGIPNPPKWHPEIDTGIHSMLVLSQAALLSDRLDVRFAALCHDLGKGETPAEHWPSHHGHETLGLPRINELCQRLRIPNDCKELALLASEYHQLIHKARELRPVTVQKLFDGIDLWRKPERLELLLTCCMADLRGRTGFEQADYPQADYLRALAKAARSVDIKALVAQGHQGEAMRSAVAAARLAAIRQAMPAGALIKAPAQDGAFRRRAVQTTRLQMTRFPAVRYWQLLL